MVELTRLAAAGNLAHLLGEALGAELAAEVVQRARLALVQQALEEEQQRHVAGGLVVHRFHGTRVLALAGWLAVDDHSTLRVGRVAAEWMELKGTDRMMLR